jgi:hypothetical protein
MEFSGIGRKKFEQNEKKRHRPRPPLGESQTLGVEQVILPGVLALFQPDEIVGDEADRKRRIKNQKPNGKKQRRNGGYLFIHFPQPDDSLDNSSR